MPYDISSIVRDLFADCSGATWYGKVAFDYEAVDRFEDYVEWKG
jgi:hypothetical protein